MANDLEPIEGHWYQHLDKGQKIQVIAIDADKGTVEVQQFDGDVDEMDFEAWYDMDIEPIEDPEDWTGPVDDVEKDDLGYTETDMESEDWNNSLRELKRGDTEESSDDWGEGYPEEQPWEREE